MSNLLKGSFAACLSGLCYAFVGYFGLTVMQSGMSIGSMTFWRFAIASLIMLGFTLPSLKSERLSLKSLRMLFLSSAVFYGSSSILYFVACQFLTTGMAMVLLFTFPVMVMIINTLAYKQKIAKNYYLAMAIILLGMIMMVEQHGSSQHLIGVLIMLFAAFLYACYIVSSKKSTLPPQISTLAMLLGCMTTAFFYALADNSLNLPKDIHIWLDLFGLAFVSTSIAILLMFYALKHISSERASILSVLEPVFVVIVGVILLGEHLKLSNAVGVVLVLSGAMLTLFTRPAKSQNETLDPVPNDQELASASA